MLRIISSVRIILHKWIKFNDLQNLSHGLKKFALHLMPLQDSDDISASLIINAPTFLKNILNKTFHHHFGNKNFPSRIKINDRKQSFMLKASYVLCSSLIQSLRGDLKRKRIFQNDFEFFSFYILCVSLCLDFHVSI